MVAAAIIPRWRFNELEPEPPAFSPLLPLVLTLVLVVVVLVDLAGNLLSTRWRRSHQVTFCCITVVKRVLALVSDVEKTRLSRFVSWFVGI